jgi:RNA polymerase sigma-70 factor (ECF subfamily)
VDDLALARALASGDEAAFQTLVEQESNRIFRICYRILGRVDEAQEAAQETFVLAYRALPTYRGDGPAAAWLARTATRHCWRRASASARRAARTLPLDDVLTATLTDPADPAQDVIAAQEREIVRSAVNALPEPYREVIALRYFGDLPLADIAAATGRPEETIKTQLRRGLERLRASMRAAP